MVECLSGYNTFRIHVPSIYKETFSHFYFAENTSSEAVTKILLPSYQIILVFSFGATPCIRSSQNMIMGIENCFILGPIKRAFEYTLPPGAEILTINFKDDSFYRFFGSAIISEHIPVNPDGLLLENCLNLLWHDMAKVKNLQNRVEHVLKFCDSYLISRDKVAEELANFKLKSINPIKAVAGTTMKTVRSIQLSHRKYFGYSAKELSRYQRFLKAIELIQDTVTHSSRIDWFTLIDECGYYDQSQLIHDFNHYISLSPAKYLKIHQDICNPIS